MDSTDCPGLDVAERAWNTMEGHMGLRAMEEARVWPFSQMPKPKKRNDWARKTRASTLLTLTTMTSGQLNTAASIFSRAPRTGMSVQLYLCKGCLVECGEA